MNFTAVLRLGDVASNNTPFPYRYAIKADEAGRSFIEAVARRTSAGNLWCFDPTSSDDEIRSRSQRDIEDFGIHYQGWDLTTLLPVGTLVIASSVRIPHGAFTNNTTFAVSHKHDEKGIVWFPELPVEMRKANQEAVDARRAFDEQAKLMLGLSGEELKSVKKEHALTLAKEMLTIKTPKIEFTEFNFKTLDATAVPHTEPADKQEDLPQPEFSNPADDSENES